LSSRRRLDSELVRRGLVETRQKAQDLIERGLVLVDGKVASRKSTPVDEGSRLELLTPKVPVSRGGLKLEGALEALGLDVRGLVAADLGSSTGGFTECLIRRGARRVYAIDVGVGLLHPSLRALEEVVVMEGVDFREVGRLPERLDLLVSDLTLRSSAEVFPFARENLKPSGLWIALVKPQYELGYGRTRDGVVVDEGARRETLSRFAREAVRRGFTLVAILASPVRGREGNLEFFVASRPFKVALEAKGEEGRVVGLCPPEDLL